MMTANSCSTEEAQILGPTLQRNLYAPDLGINYRSIRCHYQVKPAIMLIVLGACLPVCDVYQVKQQCSELALQQPLESQRAY